MLALAGVAVSAAELRVRVVDRDSGQALAGAAVCLGTGADPAQFGALLSGEDGQVRFAGVPRSRLVLTVSKPGYRGRRSELDATTAERVLVVPLAAGGLGPECSGVREHANGSEAPAARAAALPRVRDFSLAGGAATTRERRVLLRARVTGDPTEYRASERRDFGDAEWRPFSERVEFVLSPGAGRKTVYYQLRRLVERGGGRLESRSAVHEDSIVLAD